MKHLLIISCLLLCSCPVEEETEHENLPLPDTSCVLSSSSSPSQSPCTPPVFVTTSLVDPDPLILECPPEDIAEYPTYGVIPDDWCKTVSYGICAFKLKTSKEELSFNAQGGVRCITTDRLFGLYGGFDSDNYYGLRCTVEEEVEEVRSTNQVSYWRKLKCPDEYPWLTATVVDTRVLHISVNRNETGEERKMYIHPNCQANISITQSPN